MHCQCFWLPEVCETIFVRAQICKHTRTRGRGRETESSQEVWCVLALVTSPFREGWGLFMVFSRHPQCCWLFQRINKGNISASFRSCFAVFVLFALRTDRWKRSDSWCHVDFFSWSNDLTKCLSAEADLVYDLFGCAATAQQNSLQKGMQKVFQFTPSYTWFATNTWFNHTWKPWARQQFVLTSRNCLYSHLSF